MGPPEAKSSSRRARCCSSRLAIGPDGALTLEDLRSVRRTQADPADAVLFEQIDQAEVQTVSCVALNQVEAEAPELARRGRALDRDLCDGCRMQPPCNLLLDDGAGADADLVDDDLAGHDAEDDLLAAVDRHQRSLTRLDCCLADLARGRVGVELLDGAGEEQQELINRGRVSWPRYLLGWGSGGRRPTSAVQTCLSAIRSVITGACVDSHGLCVSLRIVNGWSELANSNGGGCARARLPPTREPSSGQEARRGLRGPCG